MKAKILCALAVLACGVMPGCDSSGKLDLDSTVNVPIPGGGIQIIIQSGYEWNLNQKRPRTPNATPSPKRLVPRSDWPPNLKDPQVFVTPDGEEVLWHPDYPSYEVPISPAASTAPAPAVFDGDDKMEWSFSPIAGEISVTLEGMQPSAIVPVFTAWGVSTSVDEASGTVKASSSSVQDFASAVAELGLYTFVTDSNTSLTRSTLMFTDGNSVSFAACYYGTVNGHPVFIPISGR